jgi:hypothetical protein
MHQQPQRPARHNKSCSGPLGGAPRPELVWWMPRIAAGSNAMTDDQLKEWASKASSEIVKREGAALALSACDRDEPAIEADSNLLGIAIAQAIIEAYQAGVAAASRRAS